MSAPGSPDPGSLDGFLRLAAHGYHLAPIRIRRGPDGRKRTTYFRERGAGWGEAATTDPEQITRWWQRYGPDCGFLIACVPSEIVVIDLDLKPAAEIDAVSWWAREGLPIGNLRVDTPSGGQHLYFRQRKPGTDGGPIPNSTGAIAPGVDIRGVGGQYGGLVHAPGTHVLDGEPGEVYRLLDTLCDTEQLDEIPDAITDLIPAGRRTRAARATSGAGGRSHQLSWISGEVERLTGKVRELPPREGTGFRYALMGASMMAGRLCVAVGDDRDGPAEYLRDAVRSVWGDVDTADEEWIQTGLDDGEADPYTIEPEDDEPVTPESDPDAYQVALDREIQRQRLHQDARDALAAERCPPLRPIDDVIVWGDEMDAVEPPSFALEELIPDRAVGWLGGPSGAYKSFVAVSLMLALCRGVNALGHREFTVTRRQKVLYVAAEGATGVILRARAALHRLELDGTRDHLVWREAVDFTDARALDRLVAFARQHGFTFLIVDTWRQVTPGVEENANTDVSLIMRRLLDLRDDHGIGSLLLDHTNKSAKGLADLTGAGAKRANADYVLMVDLPNGERGSDEQRTLRVAKLKDWEDGRSWPIRLEPVDEITDERGRPSAAAIVGEIDRPAGADIHGTEAWREVVLPPDVADYSGKGREALGIVARFVIHQGSGESGVSRAEALEFYRARHPEMSGDSSRQSVARAWDALHALGRLEPIGAGASRINHHRWVPDMDLGEAGR